MSEKRRDNKGRILKTGESQKKNGQYIYQYTNSFGERKVIYSWKLVTTDKVPAGKREDVSLREKIKEIERKLEHAPYTPYPRPYKGLSATDAPLHWPNKSTNVPTIPMSCFHALSFLGYYIV